MLERGGEISYTDRARNEEILNRVKEERNILHKIRGKNFNCFGYSLCKHVIEENIDGRIKVTGRLERIRKQLLDDVRKTRR
jgi:RecB family exonuclease